MLRIDSDGLSLQAEPFLRTYKNSHYTYPTQTPVSVAGTAPLFRAAAVPRGEQTSRALLCSRNRPVAEAAWEAKCTAQESTPSAHSE